MTKIVQYVMEHPTVFIAASGLIGSALSSTWPEQRPKTLDDWWAWGRDFIHQVSNTRRPTKQNSQQ